MVTCSELLHLDCILTFTKYFSMISPDKHLQVTVSMITVYDHDQNEGTTQWIKEAIAIRSTSHNFNHPQGKKHVFPHVWNSRQSSSPACPLTTVDERELTEGVCQ